jgi:hypothetical protein
MATIMLMHWPEVTEDQYRSARQVVNWEGDLPKGAKFHTSWFAAADFTSSICGTPARTLKHSCETA